MPKVILVPSGGDATDLPVLQTALAAARMFDAHLRVLHVRPDVQRDIAGLASADMGMGTGLDTVIARMEADADSRERESERLCRDLFGPGKVPLAERPCASGVTYEWLVETGDEANWLAAHGRVSDMLVISRGRAGNPAMDIIEAALMDTGKPVLIAPDPTPHTLDGVVCIAWKDTREAAGAVSAAMPFIERASKVVILTVQEDPDDNDDKSNLRLMNSLRWHNPNVTVQALGRHHKAAVDVLLDSAAAAGCSLLVMGGYGHTRLREAVFGGFTRTVLENAAMTVLIAH